MDFRPPLHPLCRPTTLKPILPLSSQSLAGALRLSGAHVFPPAVGSSAPACLAATPSVFATPFALPSFAPTGLVAPGQVRWDSTKRKRARKMNKHKYQKLRKARRNLTAKNIRRRGE